MPKSTRLMPRAKAAATIALAWGLAAGASIVCMKVTAAPEDVDQLGSDLHSSVNSQLDRSGEPRVGKASFYARRYTNRVMSDGRRMRADGINAASLTLPLGTTAKVTNLATGKSALVTIEDRGPYVHGRIIDLSPATAQRIGLLHEQGIATVRVVPLTLPLEDGTVKIVSDMRI